MSNSKIFTQTIILLMYFVDMIFHLSFPYLFFEFQKMESSLYLDDFNDNSGWRYKDDIPFVINDELRSVPIEIVTKAKNGAMISCENLENLENCAIFPGLYYYIALFLSHTGVSMILLVCLFSKNYSLLGSQKFHLTLFVIMTIPFVSTFTILRYFVDTDYAFLFLTRAHRSGVGLIYVCIITGSICIFIRQAFLCGIIMNHVAS